LDEQRGSDPDRFVLGLRRILFGLLFGIRGPGNFNRSYFVANLQDFWRRWHMSLTSWLTDYLFVPLRMTFRSLGNTGLPLPFP
jgi:alginate O-acetyltransferase complex protein AlgI